MMMYKCGSCGAELEFEAGSNICVCSYCGSKSSLTDFEALKPQHREYSNAGESSVEFSMQIESVFSLTGRGTAVTGYIEYGRICVNDNVRIISDNGSEIRCTVTEIEQFKKKLDSAQKNEHVGLILSGASGHQIHNGDIIIKGTLDMAALNREIISRFEPREKISAIAYYRQETGLELKAAKEKVDRLFSKGYF